MRGSIPAPGNLALGGPLNAGPPQRLKLKLLSDRPDLNPRTASLPEAARALVFSPERLGDLVRSIRAKGVLQPLLIRAVNFGRYEVVTGARRYHAATLAGLDEVPVYVRHEVSDAEFLELAIIENNQREDVDLQAETLNGFALMLAHLAQRGAAPATGAGDPSPEEQLIRRLNRIRQGAEPDEHDLEGLLRRTYGTGVSTWSQQRARYFQLSPEERALAGSRELDLEHLYALLKLGDRPERRTLLTSILREGWTPAQTRTQVRALLEAERGAAGRLRRQLAQALPRAEKLSGEAASRAQQLMRELTELLSG